MIVIPTYNEADNIEPIITAALAAAPGVHILVVDDSSPDGTGDIADRIASEQEAVHVLHRTSKDGLGRAYLAGFAWALERSYDVVFEMDADFSHDPSYLLPMIRATQDYDLVIGSRYVEGGGTQDWSLSRRAISQGGGLYARTVLGVGIRDLTAGFMAWRRSVLEAIDLDSVEASGYGFQIEMKYRASRMGFRILEIPIRFPDRTVGESKMSSSIFTEALSLVWKLRFKDI
ncbi:MAG: dolichyl-phosphate beta-D-mannosyltransferase [Myxococcales bacterium]|nr:dolichyl-phosphate beta-D-mannosyltransferase [Myxococcales bacterium]